MTMIEHPENSGDPSNEMILSDPLFTSDTHDRGWYHTDAEEDWCRDQGLDPNDIFRYEIYLIDMPFARMFEYVRDDGGKIIYDWDTDRAVHVIRSVPIKSYPPGMRERS